MKKNKRIILLSNIPLAVIVIALIVTFCVDSHSATEADNTTSSTFPEMARAEEGELKPHVGLQLGYADSGSSYDGAANYGIEVGYQPYIPLGAAIEVTHLDSDGDGGSDLERTTLMAKATYNFGGTTPVIRHSFAGLGVGAVADTAQDSETNIGAKALIGADFPLTETGLTKNKSFSLGAVASYLSVVDADDTFAINGQLKYWF